VKLLDVSALARLSRPTVAAAVRPLLAAGGLATCGLIDLQLYAGISEAATLAHVTALRSASFRWLPTTDTDLHTALATQRELAAEGTDARCWPSLLVAAVAARHHVPVLHYDPRFDRITKLTGQPTEWVVPAGSIQ
jgi:predicted nucleic acid-binding protein